MSDSTNPAGGKPSGFTDMPESPPELRGLHKALLWVALFFFVYLIVEATILLPTMLVKYGWW